MRKTAYCHTIFAFLEDARNSFSMTNPTGTATSPAESFDIMPRPIKTPVPMSFIKDFFSSLIQRSVIYKAANANITESGSLLIAPAKTISWGCIATAR